MSLATRLVIKFNETFKDFPGRFNESSNS